MAPHLSVRLIARDGSGGSGLSSIIVAGIIIAGAIGFGCAVWLGVRWYRKRAAEKRAERRGSAFDHFQESDDASEKSSAKTTGFSRHAINSQIIMPERAVLRPGATRDEIIEHYTAEGKLPRPFSRMMMPPANVESDELAPPPSFGERTPNGRPSSTSSWLPPAFPLAGGSKRSSAMSMASSLGSNGVPQKKVRQVFDPVLPDELVLSLGDTLTVVQQYDDGWCIVGRDSTFNPGEAELGAIPAWCFLKPVKGLRAERPMRVSSLGVTINLDQGGGPSFGPRDNVMSWSNF
ncbi:uncharacterized protein BXZ73DRAFT_38366 [Epithele typhae]|uniref:uncharacterized protein n=1 Tax=Epithele typhae TaxID=378194 RepID=UPI002007489C|nr:uncharacterized protein BXZ73DRAFT_38366 [Epithele typhae]KAH9945339.1 hypothetical protein BXZ73DRAFT_38366 [Epithele typhae]